MNDFKSEYQSAVQDMDMLGMKEIHIDALSVLDEGRHKKRMMKKMQRVTVTTFSTVCVIFLCGFGTVKAAEYIGNVIKVNEWGFESGDAATMARSDTGGSQPYIIEDEVYSAFQDESATGGGTPSTLAKQPPEEKEKKTEAEAAWTDGINGNGNEIDGNGLSETEKAAQKSRSIEESESMEDKLTAEAVVEEIPVKNYTSWEEFEKNEDIIFAQPSISIGNHITSTDITVCDDWAMVRYDVDGKVLWIERTDYADTQGHASSKVFPGGVCNERTYTTSQGYTYTLVDSVKETEDETLQIHAAITVGSYEAFIDFMGYGEEDAKAIMESIDLSVYE